MNKPMHLSFDLDKDGSLRARKVDMTCAIQCNARGAQPHQFHSIATLVVAPGTNPSQLRRLCEAVLTRLDNSNG